MVSPTATERGVVAAGTRDECLDAVERAWWRVEAATLGADQVAAAARAVRLSFERWEGAQGFVPDPILTGVELERHRVHERWQRLQA